MAVRLAAPPGLAAHPRAPARPARTHSLGSGTSGARQRPAGGRGSGRADLRPCQSPARGPCVLTSGPPPTRILRFRHLPS